MIPVSKLAIYLPYDLQFFGGNDVWDLISISTSGDIRLKNSLYIEEIPAWGVGIEYKPILRPIESFTKEEKSLYFEETYGYTSKWVNALAFTAWKLDWFIQRKFDVYGLIGERLAIPTTAFPTELPF